MDKTANGNVVSIWIKDIHDVSSERSLGRRKKNAQRLGKEDKHRKRERKRETPMAEFGFKSSSNWSGEGTKQQFQENYAQGRIAENFVYTLLQSLPDVSNVVWLNRHHEDKKRADLTMQYNGQQHVVEVKSTRQVFETEWRKLMVSDGQIEQAREAGHRHVVFKVIGTGQGDLFEPDKMFLACDIYGLIHRDNVLKKVKDTYVFDSSTSIHYFDIVDGALWKDGNTYCPAFSDLLGYATTATPVDPNKLSTAKKKHERCHSKT
jgi:hypothetical protein